MNLEAWEDALEHVIACLEAPPLPDTPQGRRFDEALRQVLDAAPSSSAEGDPTPALLDEGLRARLDDLARRRAPHNPFGDHPDGIGRTLGMDLGQS